MPSEGAELDRIRAGDVFDAVARAACVLARQIGAKAIVPLTHSGATAQRVSKYRPDMPIYAVTGREKILRRMNNQMYGNYGDRLSKQEIADLIAYLLTLE